VDEFAKKPGAAGICFAEWMPPSVPSMGGPFGSVNTPPLGYGVADRLAALQRTGEDPVDRLLSWDDYVPPSLADRRSSMMRDSYTKEPSPYQVLLEDLLKRAKAARKGWKTWLVNGHLLGDMQPGGSELDVGKAADEIIGSVFGMFRGGTKQGALLPITSQNLLATLGEEDMGGNSEIPESVLKMPPIALYNIFFAQIGHEGAGVPRMQMTSVVYDFRTSPEQITSSLQWIKAPDKEPPAKKPGG
jgi:hypothetical protein